MNKKIGFIYLDELHHIHHFLSPAIELSNIKGYDVEVLTYKAKHEYLIELINTFGGAKLKIKKLDTYLYRRIIEKLKNRSQPSALYIYTKNRKTLLKYDALIFTDHTSKIIYDSRGGSKFPKLIHLAHGSGDGNYGYQETHSLFDLIVVAGRKKAERLQKTWPKKEFNIRICGYSKFDLAKNIPVPCFTNTNPTILYAPHFKKELSSWHTLGTEVLDYFLTQPQFNLIFAPHINLFNKKGFESIQDFNSKYINASNIHVDLGSIKSIDMTYSNEADIYLGDVSSQVYEFMNTTRPLIFINAHNIKWQHNEDYLFWNAGKVINTINELHSALITYHNWSQLYQKSQKQLFKDTFELTNEKSGKRVATAIIKEL